MGSNSQTRRADRSVTVSFRASRDVKALIRAAASQQSVLPSDWVRAEIEQALVRQMGRGCLGREPLTAEALAKARYTEKELVDE